MSNKMTRTHIVIAKDLIDEIDRRVGPRHRSAFVSDAIEEKLRHERLVEIAEKAGGSLADVDIPGWETSEAAAEWVRASRRTDEERVRRLIERS